VKSKIIIFLLLVVACAASHYSFAQSEIHSQSQVHEATDSSITSSKDTLILVDSIIVIHTVCAPICSSHVRVYNKEWREIGVMKAPFQSAFPEAYIENNKVLWRDNDTQDYTPAY
jgi:hypothetical protein